jgi:hypothetical protein
VFVAGGNHRRLEHRRDHIGRPGIDDRLRRLGGGNRASPKQESRRHRRRKLPNQSDRARHRHRHLERAHAAFHECIDNRAQLRRVLDPNHRHDAELLNLLDHRRASRFHHAHRALPPSNFELLAFNF